MLQRSGRRPLMPLNGAVSSPNKQLLKCAENKTNMETPKRRSNRLYLTLSSEEKREKFSKLCATVKLARSLKMRNLAIGRNLGAQSHSSPETSTSKISALKRANSTGNTPGDASALHASLNRRVASFADGSKIRESLRSTSHHRASCRKAKQLAVTRLARRSLATTTEGISKPTKANCKTMEKLFAVNEIMLASHNNATSLPEMRTRTRGRRKNKDDSPDSAYSSATVSRGSYSTDDTPPPAEKPTTVASAASSSKYTGCLSNTTLTLASSSTAVNTQTANSSVAQRIVVRERSRRILLNNNKAARTTNMITKSPTKKIKSKKTKRSAMPTASGTKKQKKAHKKLSKVNENMKHEYRKREADLNYDGIRRMEYEELFCEVLPFVKPTYSELLDPPMPNLIGVDTSKQWMVNLSKSRLNEFLDVSESEKGFFVLWNSFTMRRENRSVGCVGLPFLLERFVTEFGEELVRRNFLFNFISHCVCLCKNNLISEAQMFDAIFLLENFQFAPFIPSYSESSAITKSPQKQKTLIKTAKSPQKKRGRGRPPKVQYNGKRKPEVLAGKADAKKICITPQKSPQKDVKFVESPLAMELKKSPSKTLKFAERFVDFANAFIPMTKWTKAVLE